MIRRVKQNAVLTIAVLAALISLIAAPSDKEYASYVDYRTLSCLFCTLAIVCALKNIDFFYILARRIVSRFRTTRLCVLALVCITFLGSMLIANDMALITFLPLGYFVLKVAGREKLMAYVFILQNIAANLGGMLTPFGNPQNLYIYTKYEIETTEFMQIMFLPFLVSLVLLAICCMAVKNEELEIPVGEETLDKKKTILYFALFALAISVIFRAVPYGIGLAAITGTLLLADKDALKRVDYPLLLTFTAFFVFAGNMARIGAVRAFFSGMLAKNALLTSVVSCQFISNVPTAILLSQFTDNYKDLLLGVNIGGVGTLIASLASLITFREYLKYSPGEGKSYLRKFTALNFMFLTVLVILSPHM